MPPIQPDPSAPVAAITSADIEQLKGAASPAARAGLAGKLGTQYSEGRLTDRERQLANDIFRLLVADAETQVRRTLSESLKTSPDLPHDIALTLARDIEEVATPMLECSLVLT